MTSTLPCRPLRTGAILALLALPAFTPTAAVAERIAPLSPAPSFDALTVPLPPQRPEPPSVRVVPTPSPVIIPPGSIVLPQPPVRIEKTQAQAAPASDDPIGDSLDALLGNVLREMQPTFDDMARGLDGAAAKFGPALNELGDLVDDIGNYQAPERLPNGDILIRRRADAPPAPEIGPALRDLTSPGATTGDLAPPATGPGTPAPAAPGDQPALANPIPELPADPNQPKIDL